MNRKRFIYTNVLVHTLFVAIGCLNTAKGQEDSIIVALPEMSNANSRPFAYQEPTPVYPAQDPAQLDVPSRPDQQDPTFNAIQDQQPDLKTLQGLEGEQLADALQDDKISDLFKKGQWPLKGIRAISLDIREKGDEAPEDVASGLVNSQAGRWNSFNASPKVFAWAAPNIRYQPLYFEDVALERYGQTKGHCRQAAHSAVHFFTSAVLLPLHMHHERPASCDYPLGFCRPGADVPYTHKRLCYGHEDR